MIRSQSALQLGRPDAAAAAIQPVLDLPVERRISWIRKRLSHFDELLVSKPYHGSSAIQSLTRN
jgi:hypothetical protein